MSKVLPESLKLFRNAVMGTKNPLGLPMSECAKWCDYEKKETILYSGCLYSTMDIVMQKKAIHILTGYPKDKLVRISKTFLKLGSLYKLALKAKPRISQIPKKAFALLRTFGYDVGCLRNEPYSGALLYDYGFYDDFREYANWLHNFFVGMGIKRLIVLDPHTYEIMAYVYPQFVDNYELEVINILDIIMKEIENSVSRPIEDEVTIHDPCHYARSRYRPIINEPREILRKIGVRIVEAKQSKEFTWCCGGPIESLYGIVANRIADIRIEQLSKTNVKKVVVMCPVCYSNLWRARRRMKKDLVIVDLIELVYKSVVGEE